jgi:hypothetical protein
MTGQDLTHPRCPDCPIASRCAVEWSGHRRYCEWARMGGHWLDGLRRISAAGPAAPRVAVDDGGAGPDVRVPPCCG